MILSYLVLFFIPFVVRQSLRQPVDGCGGAGAEQGRWRCALQNSQDSLSHISSCVVLFTPVALTFFVYSCLGEYFCEASPCLACLITS